ncbi:hypothetical protein C8N47_107153 [Mangrovibacterium marinum]|uniref:Uncharacterized protein n=1 Tax=Mangrovibacterium marinum TaxID=1639118 RepID=A0A2T5C271_9BACT|nr:hypothetical protein C8N47_107153 [Mangrovibacterium marinum]
MPNNLATPENPFSYKGIEKTQVFHAFQKYYRSLPPALQPATNARYQNNNSGTAKVSPSFKRREGHQGPHLLFWRIFRLKRNIV